MMLEAGRSNVPPTPLSVLSRAASPFQVTLLPCVREHCGSGRLGECTPVAVRPAAGGKPLRLAQSTPGITGYKSPKH